MVLPSCNLFSGSQSSQPANQPTYLPTYLLTPHIPPSIGFPFQMAVPVSTSLASYPSHLESHCRLYSVKARAVEHTDKESQATARYKVGSRARCAQRMWLYQKVEMGGDGGR